MVRRIRVNSTVLSMAIAHTQTEQPISPIITHLTIQCACQNRLNRERSEEVSPICGRSAGFIDYPFGSAGQGASGGAVMAPTGAPRATSQDASIKQANCAMKAGPSTAGGIGIHRETCPN